MSWAEGGSGDAEASIGSGDVQGIMMNPGDGPGGATSSEGSGGEEGMG